MTIQEAIQKAIEGGYDKDALTVFSVPSPQKESYLAIILLQSSFWKALGKAMGWVAFEEKGDEILEIDENGKVHPLGSWLCHWHRLIDHLAAGGSIEEFFGELK